MHEKLVKKQHAAAKSCRKWSEIEWKKKSPAGLRKRTWLIGILGFLLASLFIINNLITGQFRVAHIVNITQGNIIENEVDLDLDQDSSFLVKNRGCRIAALQPIDEFSKKFIEVMKPIECEFGNQLPLVESNDTFLFINKDAISQYYNDTDTIDCCWRSFTRKKYSDNSFKYDVNCHKFDNSTRVFDAEYVRVECYKPNRTRIFRDYYIFVPRKEETEKRCQLADEKSEESNEINESKVNKKKLSVLIMGLDSISRLNFHRMMPKTVKTLEKLGAIEMLGYNKIGDNTFPNLIPVLTGWSDKELENNCWNNSNKPFDNCPFIWKNFSSSGYRTIFAEDACSMTTFNYLKPGFHIQPTDYYYRPYCLASENDIGNTHKLNANLCVGTRLTYQNLLNYTTRVARKFKNSSYFAFFWEASLTHDFFNYPQLGDVTYHETIEYLFRDGLMNDTALIVMSDHGIRWGEFRQTLQGRIEGSLPFVFLIFPDWWKKIYSKAWTNLRGNSASLTTPFDLHETLVDILDTRRISSEAIRERKKAIDEAGDNDDDDDYREIPRGISWFLPIPDYRTCETAKIPGHWCMCHKSNNISIDNDTVKNATNYLVKEINSMLNKYSLCRKLKLDRIIDAKVWNSRDNIHGAVIPWMDYTITIVTVPGYGKFEATIRRSIFGSGNNNSSYFSDNIVGSISRLNAYGNQSSCINDSKMRLYCYCH